MAARARAEEVEAVLQAKRSERELTQFESQQRDEADRKRVARERKEREAAEALERAAREDRRLEAEAKKKADAEAAAQRLRSWRREAPAELGLKHIPDDASRSERAAALRAIERLVAESTPDDPPSAEAIEAALVEPLAPTVERRDAESRRRAEEERRSQAEHFVTVGTPWDANDSEREQARKNLHGYLADHPRENAAAVASAVLRDLNKAVKARTDAAAAAERGRREAEARERSARSQVSSGVLYPATDQERSDAMEAFERRRLERPGETPEAAAATVLRESKARTDSRVDAERAAQQAKDQKAADTARAEAEKSERKRAREEWKDDVARQFINRLDEVIAKMCDDLLQRHIQAKRPDPVDRVLADKLREVDTYVCRDKFRESLKSLETGEDLGDLIEADIEELVDDLTEAAEEEVGEDEEDD